MTELPLNSPLWLIVTFMVLSFIWKEIIKPFRDNPDKYFNLIDKIRGRTNKVDAVADQVAKDRHIAHEIDIFRQALGADRANVWGFHNGEAWLGNNESKKKMSIKKELVSFDEKGVPKVPLLSLENKSEYENIPVSQVSWWLDEIINLRLRFEDTTKCPDLITRHWYSENNVKSVIGLPVKNEDGNTTLVISYEWLGEVADPSKWEIPEGVDLSTSDKLMAYFVAQHDRLKVYL